MLWYPYKQMKNGIDFPTLASAFGVMLEFENGQRCIDGISSWWAAIHGYNHPELNAALQKQSEKFSHIMLGGITHHPAKELARKLVEITPSGLDHVFFSDSGSVGVEVALKMAIQYWKNKGVSGKNRFVSLINAYHGDTFKAMEVSDDSDFSQAFSQVLRPGFRVKIPTGGYISSENEIQIAILELEGILKEHASEIAAFIVEPIVQCAGGFHIYSPRYLEKAKTLCEQYNVLLIYDEVATGFGRSGKLFAANHADVVPDIMILGKALTAGYLGHAATLASSEIFESFYGDSYEKAFMHGPTFMGNPLACAVAIQGIKLIQDQDYIEKIKRIEFLIAQAFSKITASVVVAKRQIGAIGAIEMQSASQLAGFSDFAAQNGVWLRPIGNVVYLMPPYIIEESQLQKIIDVISQWIDNLSQ